MNLPPDGAHAASMRASARAEQIQAQQIFLDFHPLDTIGASQFNYTERGKHRCPYVVSAISLPLASQKAC
jgi:hypothetical protein